MFNFVAIWPNFLSPRKEIKTQEYFLPAEEISFFVSAKV